MSEQPFEIKPKAVWDMYDSNTGTAICSNCHRQDHVDSLATHCRYCGVNIAMPKKKKKKTIDGWLGPFNSIWSDTTYECPNCHMYVHLQDTMRHYPYCPWCSTQVIKEVEAHDDE